MLRPNSKRSEIFAGNGASSRRWAGGCAFTLFLLAAILIHSQFAQSVAAAWQSSLNSLQEAERPIAQESGNSTPTTTQDNLPQMRKSKVTTYYVRKNDGELVPLIGIPFEQLESMQLALDEREAVDRVPSYSIEKLSGTIHLKDEFAQVEFQFKVRCQAKGWIRIPISLTAMILSHIDSHSDHQPMFVEYDQNQKGYVLWIECQTSSLIEGESKVGGEKTETNASNSSTQEISFRGLLKPRAQGQQNLFSIALPDVQITEFVVRSDAKSELTVMNSSAIVSTSIDQQADARETRIEGAKGELVLGVSSSAALKANLKVESNLDCYVVSASAMRLNLEWNIVSYGQMLTDFSVRLPRAFELIGYDSSRMKVSKQEPDSESAWGIWKVEIREPARSAKGLSLFGSLPLSLNIGEPTKFDFSNYWIDRAFIHTGRIRVIANPEIPLQLETGQDLLRVKPDGIAAEQSRVEQYQFHRIPLDLRLHLETAFLQRNGKATMRLTPNERGLRLDTNWELYGIAAKQSTIEFRTQGFVFEPFQPADWIVSQGVDPQDANIYRIQVKPELIPAEGILRLSASAVRTLDPSSPFALRFPFPVDIPCESTEFILAPDSELLSNRRIESALADSLGVSLKAQAVGSTATEVGSNQRVFQFDLPLDQVVFAGQIVTVRRELKLHHEMYLALRNDRLVIQQSCLLHSSSPPLAQLRFLLPRGVSNRGVTVDLDERAGSVIGSNSVLSRLLGREEITVSSTSEPNNAKKISFTWEVSRTAANQIASDEWSQIEPVLVVNSARIPDERIWEAGGIGLAYAGLISSTLDNIQVEKSSLSDIELSPSEWFATKVDPDQMSSVQKYLTINTENIASIRYRIKNRVNASMAQPIVSKMWVQTTLGFSTRFERTAIQITPGAERQFCVQLPPQANLISALLNGQDIRSAWDQKANQICGDWNDFDAEQQLLEISYQIPTPSPATGYVTSTFPQIASVDWSNSVYWEIITPVDRQLAFSTAGLAPLMKLKWKGIWLVREPTLSQADLENWIGATRLQTAAPQAHRYLFSTFGEPADFVVSFVGRREFFLGTAFIALMIGGLLFAWPTFRSGFFLLALLVLGCAVGVRYPEIGIPAVQICLLIGLLSFGVLMLNRAFGQRSAVMGRKYSDSRESERAGLIRSAVQPSQARGRGSVSSAEKVI